MFTTTQYEATFVFNKYKLNWVEIISEGEFLFLCTYLCFHEIFLNHTYNDKYHTFFFRTRTDNSLKRNNAHLEIISTHGLLCNYVFSIYALKINTSTHQFWYVNH